MAKAAQFDSDAFVGQKPDMTPSMAHLTLSEELGGSNLSLNKRSMVLDEDRFEDLFLKCFICKERFTNTSLPRMLPCHHSFCQSCINHLFDLAKEHKHSLQSTIRGLSYSVPPGAVSVACPTCRATFIATSETIKRLSTDHRVVQLMDFVHHTDHCTVTFCSRHNLQPLNFFCEPCLLPLCRDCTELDHKEDDGHLVIDLEDAMTKYTPVLDSAITEMEAEIISLEEKGIILESVTNHLDSVKSDLIGQVHSCMARMRELLNEREKVLIAKVHQETEKERNKLIEKAALLDSRREIIVEKSSKLRQAKDNGHVEEMFRIHQDVREFRAEPAVRIREIDDGLMTSFVLNTRDEAMLASRINNFGDVVSKVETTSSRVKTKVSTFLTRPSSYK
ncbi:unnamed protein product [Candidula unifasciata]|uniref:RING-type domain-containing protein n=1 Tax=Candidula unifasciata TaxID=100452 RepID=A0A8S3ZHG6_9EUPU|nr:unnamed protein product [Candidula unifasciata]